MLNALYELGKTYIEKESCDEIDILVDDLKTTKSIILIEFEINDNKIKWTGVKEKSFEQAESNQYLYRKGSSRGTNLTPSALITKKPTSTFNLKFFKWFKNEKSNSFIKPFYDEINENKESILENMEKVFSNIEIKNNVLLTLSVEENGDRKYLNDYSFFQQHLKSMIFEKYYKKSSRNLEMKGRGQCLLCGEDKEVFGLVPNANGFKFSTEEKNGNLQELSYVNQWKMVPICFDCTLKFRAGYKFVDRYLSFSEFGLNYYVIPKFLFKKDDVIDRLFDCYLEEFKDKKSYYNTIATEEDDIFIEVEDLDNFLEFTFFFYERNNSAFNILGNVESVVPSWINRLRTNQRELIKTPLFSEDAVKEIFMKKDFAGNFLNLYNSNKNEDYQKVNDSKWFLGFLRDFFLYKDNNNFKFFIDVVSSFFSGKKVNFDFILTYAMKKIRNDFRHDNEYFMKISTMELLCILKLLSKLNLNFNGENMENLVEKNEKVENNQLIKYMDELNTSAKKASFLLGVLTRKLISEQYKELKTTPFTNKLWGLSLDEKKIQKLYPMVINKLNEYKKLHYYIELSQEISKNLLESENNWKLTRDETSFYFVLGYTLYRLYKKPKKDNNSDNGSE